MSVALGSRYFPTMAVTFDEKAQALLDAANLPVVATVNADGSPHSSIVLMKRAEHVLYFPVHRNRRTERNISRDPRVNISLYDLGDPYTSIEIRGLAEVLPEGGNDLAHELIRRYMNERHDLDDPTRVAVRVIPQKVIHFPDPARTVPKRFRLDEFGRDAGAPF
ncbi:PPOX class F420-dependent oxidoreductase [Parafrankia sp. EUN1f]|uniref:PPOX class F420-dependent oxidoreductase n=1 Tax=Parafrankia sp. EUN1f TaxID=102897 RepID=UPI0001C45A6B|nr:PPOX class F420-dependent oxidoreductase [Parafrankia sp. EUN1f]EFC82757.1 pyridoxamine 5'-phosphate oxidase-related FMN-binding protein [Parafrankia sp. EUN1f]